MNMKNKNKKPSEPEFFLTRQPDIIDIADSTAKSHRVLEGKPSEAPSVNVRRSLNKVFSPQGSKVDLDEIVANNTNSSFLPRIQEIVNATYQNRQLLCKKIAVEFDEKFK